MTVATVYLPFDKSKLKQAPTQQLTYDDMARHRSSSSKDVDRCRSH